MNSGRKSASNRNAKTLGSRDRQILEDVVRYRLITNDWILNRYLEEAKPNAAIKISNRLVREGWLTPHRLFQRKQYFTAGTSLVRKQGLPIGRTRPLGSQALAIHYAALRYCALSGVNSHQGTEPRLATFEELKHLFSWLPQPLLYRPHVLSESKNGVDWKVLRIDMGGRPDHVARKIIGDIKHLEKHSEFTSVLNDRKFTQVVLCPSPNKKRLIEQALSDRTWPRGLRFQMGVLPELFQLLAIQ